MRVPLAFVLLLWPGGLLASPAQDLPPGTVIDKVACREDAKQSYALYLPAAYSPGRTWPVLYALDPGALGRIPVNRFRDAAEKYGFIVVGSNNSRNGPVEIVQAALNAMLSDTRARFALDPGRVYLTGFSGGARMAVLAGVVLKGQAAGVLGFGAGFPPSLAPTASLPFAYFGAAGADDFNYPELRNLDDALAGLGLPHRFEVFDGGHDWPPESVCTRAIAWMELQGMASGRRAKDGALVDQIFARAVAEASAEERAGRMFQAFSRYQEVAKDFAGLRDVTPFAQKAAELERSPEVRQARADLKDSIDRQQRLAARIEQLSVAAVGVEDRAGAARDLAAGLADLRRQADRTDRPADRMAARRVLAVAWLHLDDMVSGDFQRGEFVLAAIRLRAMAQIRPENAMVEYVLARACARSGGRKEAIAALQRAIAKGFTDAGALERQPDLESLRGDAAFREIVDGLKSKQRDS